MGNNNIVCNKINFEDIQHTMKNADIFFIINTMSQNEQSCLINNTTPIDQEERIINNFIKTNTFNVKIIIYGKNSNEGLVEDKAAQLRQLGFTNIYIYLGGMFEWLMLQDIYGEEEFPTTTKEIDILKYKPIKKLDIKYIDY